MNYDSQLKNTYGFFLSSIYGYIIWNMIDEFNSCKQHPLILPFTIVICFAIKKKFKIIMKKLFIWRILGILFAFVVPNLTNMATIKVAFISIGIAYSLNSNFSTSCLLDGALICYLVKLAFYSTNCLNSGGNFRYLSIFFFAVVSFLQERYEKSQGIDDLLFYQEKALRKYPLDWAKIGLWLFLVKKNLLTAQFSDPFYPTILVSFCFIVFKCIQERFNNERIVAAYYGLSGISLVLARQLVKNPLALSIITALGVIGLKPLKSDESRKWQMTMKSLLLFCKLAALDSKFIGNEIFANICVLASAVLSLFTFRKNKDLKDSRIKPKTIYFILITLWTASAIIRGSKRSWRKRVFEAMDLDQIRIQNLASEAVYLIKDDLDMMPLLRVSITMDPKCDLEVTRSLIMSLDLDLVVIVKEQFSMNGMFIGEQTDKYYFYEDKKYSLLSKYPLTTQGSKDHKDVSWISIKVSNRIVNLIMWVEKVRRSNIGKLRSLQEELLNSSTLLLGTLHVTPLKPDYHLVFKPTTLNPSIFPK
jgi:hypothetical protein